MMARFGDRREAGRLLGEKLAKYAGLPDVMVLALPRGGVPVAYEVARALGAPLDVFVVRKLGVPGQEELAMGAIASGGVRFLNYRVINALGVSAEDIEETTERETRELNRREVAFRGDRPMPAVEGKTVILVDDGIATGSTVRAAIQALLQHRVGRLVLATPTVAWTTARELEMLVDELVAVITPVDFHGVGQWYEDFTQTTDGEVRGLLAPDGKPAHCQVS